MNSRALTRSILVIAIAFLALASLLLLVNGQTLTPAHAVFNVRYVADTGSDSSACLTRLNPCATVQHAIDVAAAGDEIRVATGVYTGVSARPRMDITTTGFVTQVVYIDKPLTLRGGYAVGNWDESFPLTQPTVLYAQTRGRVIYVTGNLSATIDGLRLTGGNATGLGGLYFSGPGGGDKDAGGGLAIYSATMQIINTDIFQNLGSAKNDWAYCGGALLYNSPSVITSSLIANNIASMSNYGEGGGLCVFSSQVGSVRLINNQIVSNTASMADNGEPIPALGGGVSIWKSRDVSLSGNAIQSNRAHCPACMDGAGGGVAIWESNVGLGHNLIAENAAGGISVSGFGGGVYATTSTVSLEANLIRGNKSTEDTPTTGGILAFRDGTFFNLVNNLIVHNTSHAIDIGSSSYGTLLHNTIADNTGLAITSNANQTMTVVNNIFAYNQGGISASTIDVLDHNLFWSNTPLGDGLTGTFPVLADPLFAAPGLDYHLQMASPAHNAGANAGVFMDMEYHPRPIGPGFDVGCYESPASIQEAIDAAPPGGTVFVPSGIYTESLTLYKSVNLVGESNASTIIHAVPSQRVMTVTGASISNSVVISGLTFMGGDSTAGVPVCPDGCGGGILVGDMAQPRLQNVIISNNRAYQGGGLYVNSGNVLLKDVDIVGNTAANNGGGVSIGTGAVTLTSGLIGNNSVPGWGGGVFVDSPSAALIQQGGSIEHNDAASGGGVQIEYGTLTLYGGRIFSNTAYNDGGGVFVKYGTLTQSNGGIDSNYTPGSGGGIYVVTDLGQAILSGGQVAYNTADSSGGGVYILAGNVTLNGGQIVNNQAMFGGGVFLETTTALFKHLNGQISYNQADGGGGVKIESGQFAMLDGQINSNHGTMGGGVDVFGPDALFNQTGGAVLSNTATNNGGGLYVVSGTVVISGAVVIANNRADVSGGGAFLDNEGSLIMRGGLMTQNWAYVDGGGVYLNDSSAVFTQTWGEISQNTASMGNGGGVYVSLGRTSIKRGKITGNTAGVNGGGLFANDQLDVNSSLLFNNHAGGDGGALYQTGNSSARVVNSLLVQNTTDMGAEMSFNANANATLLHLTLASSSPMTDTAIAVNGGAVGITNTIVADHSAGINRTGGAVWEDYNLYHNIPVSLTGVINSGGHSLTGNPAFVNPTNGDYHIMRLSDALNRGANASVFVDMDGKLRPVGAGFDIGAYEAQIVFAVTDPSIGVTLVYTSANGTVTQLEVPVGAVTRTATIVYSLIESSTVPAPLPGYVVVGDNFELDALPSLASSINLSLTSGVTLTIHYVDADVTGINERLLGLYRAVNTGWERIGTRPGEWQRVDVANNVLLAHLLGFSKWGSMGTTGGSTIYLPIVLK